MPTHITRTKKKTRSAKHRQFMAHKARENLARRAAARQGFRLTKIRRYDPRALDYGKYNLIDVAAGAKTLPRTMSQITLDEVEKRLRIR